MPANRSRDWWKQALHDRDAARHNAGAGIFDWACFIAQQAAEKALKALIQDQGGDAWGHALRDLIALLPPAVAVPSDVEKAARSLDRYYIPTRYPNGIDSGTPSETYGRDDAQIALGLSETIMRFVERHLSGPGAGN